MTQHDNESFEDGRQSVMITKLHEQNKNILLKLNDIWLCIHGEPGCNESTGLVVRVDRLEQALRLHVWVVRMLATAVVGVLGELFLRYLKVK